MPRKKPAPKPDRFSLAVNGHRLTGVRHATVDAAGKPVSRWEFTCTLPGLAERHQWAESSDAIYEEFIRLALGVTEADARGAA